MTTIIIVIAAIAIVADLISRMSKKGSSESPSSESSGPKLRNPDHIKKAQALVEKAIKMSEDTHQGNNENDQAAIYFEDALELSKKSAVESWKGKRFGTCVSD